MSKPPLLSLIIPVYNEAQHLQEFLVMIDNFSLPNAAVEYIFVDDKSSDDSLAILQAYDFKKPTKILTHPKNIGKGGCILTALKHCKGDVIGVQDCDFEYRIEEIATLIAPIVAGKIDVSFGSRFHPNNSQVHNNFHYLKNKAITILSNLCSNMRLTDASCGYKFYHSATLKKLHLTSKRFSIDTELVAKTARLTDVRVREYPISYRPRTHAQGKKITWRDGVAVSFWIIFYNLLLPSSKFFNSNQQSRPSNYRLTH
ncbi:MAG: glycosyltransferase family 2 protein [Pseudomonadota bacterium]|nr:glycosyltransferase family 2 protein [Pseudomonadota bacterium]